MKHRLKKSQIGQKPVSHLPSGSIRTVGTRQEVNTACKLGDSTRDLYQLVEYLLIEEKNSSLILIIAQNNYTCCLPVIQALRK